MNKKFLIRELNISDAPLMLEWMHDDNVINYMSKDFSNMKIRDCKNFIRKSKQNLDIDKPNEINLAIVSAENEYLGTVSLKNITSKHAEFAIAVRSEAMGTGCAIFGTNEILNFAKDIVNLKYVYWYVNKNNRRAIKFYNKNNFPLVSYSEIEDIISLDYSIEDNDDYIWYLIKL